jgi:hypothetical protein
MIVVYCCTKQMKTFSIDKIMTTESGKFKGPPSAPEWAFGRRHAVRGDRLRRQVDARTQHEHGARPGFHTASSVKRAKL